MRRPLGRGVRFALRLALDRAREAAAVVADRLARENAMRDTVDAKPPRYLHIDQLDVLGSFVCGCDRCTLERDRLKAFVEFHTGPAVGFRVPVYGANALQRPATLLGYPIVFVDDVSESDFDIALHLSRVAAAEGDH